MAEPRADVIDFDTCLQRWTAALCRLFRPWTRRHSTAMHLLQSGVDISVIVLWLGHETIKTTHIHIEADLATKERALAKLTPAEGAVPRFKAADYVLAFLDSL